MYTVNHAFFGAIFIVELRLGYAAVQINRGERQLALRHHLMQTVDTRCCFVGNTLKAVALLGELSSAHRQAFFDLRGEGTFCFRCRHLEQAGFAQMG